MDQTSNEKMEVASPEDGAQDQRAQYERLQAIGVAMARERKQYTDDRAASGVERRWQEDMDFYHGRDRMVKETENLMERLSVHGESAGGYNPSDEKVTRSRVFLNITRPKTNAAEARVADMLLPVDERNWGIKPTPVPELAEQLSDDETKLTQNGAPLMVADKNAPQGQRQMTAADQARQVLTEAIKRAERMQAEIDDQLTECDYNSESRMAIRDASRLGTGILKGPIVVNRMKKSWRPMQDSSGEVIHVLQVVEEKRPATERVDPWNFFPDMSCTDIKNAKAIWERKPINARELRALARAPGYMVDQIRSVLAEGPRKVSDVSLRYIPDGDNTKLEDNQNFELWERHGDIDKELLELCGCETDRMDELSGVSGCVVMVNNTVVKVYLNPLDTEDMIYDVFQWEPSENSVFGYGVPFMLRQASQRILNAAVRQLMDNSGASTGPMVVMRKGAVVPADGRYEITGRKIFFATDKNEAINDVFSSHEISAHIDEYIKIIDLALKFADEEIALPMIMAGEKGSAPDHVGSMQMLMNAATTVLRRLVKRYDDQITKRHIRRYYDWNMQYSKKAEVKGDYEVDARGSTALMQRDLQNQAIIKWVSALSSPAIGYMFEKEKMLRKALQADYIVPDDVLKTPDQIKQIEKQMAEQKPQPSPDKQIEVEGRLQEKQIEQQTDLAIAQLSAQGDEKDRQQALLIKAIENDSELKNMLNMRGINTDRLKADLAKQVMQIRQDREAMAMNPRPSVVTVT